jgi:hypothetical protein
MFPQLSSPFPLPLQVGASLPPGTLLIVVALVLAFLSPILFAVVVFVAYDGDESSGGARDGDGTERNPDRETDSDRDASGTTT